MSEPSDRDTHFAGFAKLLYEDLYGSFGALFDAYSDDEQRAKAAQDIHERLAQRAYDLVAHTILHTSSHDLDVLDSAEIPPRIPDLTAWPEETP